MKPADLFRRALGGLGQHGHTMRERIVRGSVWIFMSQVTDQILALVQSVFVFRIAGPDAWGAMAKIMVGVNFAQQFTTTGVNQACVQRPEMTERVLNTAWVMEMARNLLMALIIVIMAFPLSSYFSETEGLRGALLVVALRFVFMAFRNIGVNLLVREMHFQRHEIYQRVVTFCGVASTIGLVFHFRDYRALVWGQVVYGFMEMVGSYIVHPYRPRFQFNYQDAVSLFRYGSQLLIGSMVGFLRGNLDVVVLGKNVLSDAQLGFYKQAQNLAGMPGGVLLTPIWTVTFPAYSRIGKNIKALKEGFVRVFRVALSFCVPLYVGLAIVAPALVHTIYGPKAAPVAPLLEIFCLVTALRVMSSASYPAFQALGRPILQSLTSFINLAFYLPAVYLLVLHSALPPETVVLAAVWAKVIAECASVATNVIQLRLQLGMRVGQLLAAARPTLLATAFMVLCLLPALWVRSTSILWMIGTVVTGATAYALFHWFGKTLVLQDYRQVASSLLRKEE